jgi:hypothetical protein
LEQKKQDLKYFMARRIAQLIEEQENRSKLVVTRNIDVEAARTLGDPQKTEVLTPDKEKVLPLNPRKESQQRAVTMLKDDKNRNGKETTETRLTGKKARKLSKKRDKIYRIFQRELRRKKICRIGASSGYQNMTHGTSPWRSNIVVGADISVRLPPRTDKKSNKGCHQTIGPCHNGSNKS